MTQTGAGPNGGFGGAGDVWNSYVTPPGFAEDFAARPLNNLVDSTGAATGVDLTFTGVGGAFKVDWMGDDLTSDGIYCYPGLVGYTYDGYYANPQYTTTMTDSIEWELSGLTAGGSYQMANYSSDNTMFNIDMTIDTNGDGDLSDETPFTVVADGTPDFTSITASAGGTISGSLTTAAGIDEGHWSGFQLIPEPATVALLGLGGLVLRRRRS